MGIGAVIGGIASSVIGASSANKAAKAQQAAAGSQLALERQVYEETTERFEPFRAQGLDAQNALAFELGLADRPTFGATPLEIETLTAREANAITQRQPGQSNENVGYVQPAPAGAKRYQVGDQIFDSEEAAQQYAQANATGGIEYQGFQATPGYQFQLDQGLNAIDSSAASRGNLFSGATLQAAQGFGQGLANQEYNNFLNRLTGLSSSGQAAAGNQANAGANFATGAGNAFANFGNAQAAGSIGVGNALSNGISNTIGILNYQNQLAGQQTNSLFG